MAFHRTGSGQWLFLLTIYFLVQGSVHANVRHDANMGVDSQSSEMDSRTRIPMSVPKRIHGTCINVCQLTVRKQSHQCELSSMVAICKHCAWPLAMLAKLYKFSFARNPRTSFGKVRIPHCMRSKVVTCLLCTKGILHVPKKECARPL